VRELGIRRAIGATAADVMRLVLGDTARLLVYGLALGLVAAVALCQLLVGQLYGIRALDPATFVLVPVLVAMLTLAAAWLPARWAARVEPMTALREE
jgi:ABC-type antimicrobial peptide transport system permease subunit